MDIKKILKRFAKIVLWRIYLFLSAIFIGFFSLIILEMNPGQSTYYSLAIIIAAIGLLILFSIKVLKAKAISIIIFLVLSFIAFILLSTTVVSMKKPAIYLYPEEDSMVSVKLGVKGIIAKDIPAYKNGWNVFATKEGIIDNKYDYLFYEAVLFGAKFPGSGWVVGYGELKSWFEDNLIKLGLNEKEKNQFIDYWLGLLPKADYYQIKLADKKFLDEYMRLDISPKPDTEIRLLFEFTPLSEKAVISEPEIIAPKRNGFTAVEWGGILR